MTLKSFASIFFLFFTCTVLAQMPLPPKIDVETLFFGLSTRSPEQIRFVNGLEDRRVWNYEPGIIKNHPDSIKNPEKIKLVSIPFGSIRDLDLIFRELAFLPNLEYVEIRTATQFRKEDVKEEFELPQELSGIKNIRFLQISGSYEMDYRELFERLQEFEHLEYLGLGRQLEDVVLPINFTNLEDLKGLKFSGFKGLVLPRDLSQMKNFQALSLTIEGMDDLLGEFRKINTLPNFKELQLRYVELDEEQLNYLKNFTALERLEFFNFEIPRLQALFDNLPPRSKIRHLRLANLTTEESPLDYSNLMGLERLEVSLRAETGFEPQGNFFELKKLKFLKIHSNKQFTHLSEKLGDLENLEILDLSYNSIEELPETIGKLHQLRELHLNNNDLESLPEGITALKRLKVLSADNNRIRKLPQNIGALGNLEILSLNQNRLQTLPASITNLVLLEELNLTTNDLVEMPGDIGNLGNLKALPLQQNLLKLLPDSFTKLEKLEELRLTSNHLKDLPQEIGNLSNLRQVFLGNESNRHITRYVMGRGMVVDSSRIERGKNKITALPSSLSKLKNLERLYLSGLETLDEERLFEVLFDLEAKKYRVDLPNCGISSLPQKGWENFKGAELYLGGNIIPDIPKDIINAPYLKNFNFRRHADDGLSHSFNGRAQLLAFFEEEGFIPFDSLPRSTELAKAYLNNSYHRKYTGDSEGILTLMEKAFKIDSAYTAENIREDDYAQALLRAEKYPKAIKYFTQAIQQDTSSSIRVLNFIVPQFQNRAKAYLATGDTLAAVKDLEVVSERFGANEWGKAMLLAKKINKDSLAEHLFEKGVEDYQNTIDWNEKQERVNYGHQLSLLEHYIISNKAELSRSYFEELRKEDISPERNKILLEYLGLVLDIMEGNTNPSEVQDFKIKVLKSDTAIRGWSFDLFNEWLEGSNLKDSEKVEIRKLTRFLQ